MQRVPPVVPPAPSPGLALGSGAARGLAHIGVLKVLHAAGIRPAAVSGTSMGALVGALYCLHGDALVVEEKARRLTSGNLLRRIPPQPSSSGLVSAERLERLLRELFADATFADLAVPFACVATDMQREEAVVFRSGPLAAAVRASISVPLVIPPAYHHRRPLLDGALVDPVPVGLLKEMGARMTIAVDVMPPLGHTRTLRRQRRKSPFPLDLLDALLDRSHGGKRRRGPTMLDIALFSLDIMQQELTALRFAAAPPDVLIPVDTAPFRLYDFHCLEQIVTRGVVAAETALPDIHRLLHSPA